MVKIQKQAKGNLMVSFPKKLMAHYDFSEDTEFIWCVSEKGPILIPLKSRGIKNEG